MSGFGVAYIDWSQQEIGIAAALSEDKAMQAAYHLKPWIVFGWYLKLESSVNPRSWANFPMQANGAKILCLACC